MDKELRILILEDSPADAELEEYELKQSGLVFTSKVTDTKEAFLKNLDEFLPDLILSDYDLPAFDGLAALRIAKEKCPDVPFILVTGKLGEEFAIEKLKEGATDYVLKNNLKRLVPSVKRALEEAKLITDRKRAEEELKKETLRRSILMDISLDGIAIINQKHKVVEANRRFAEMLGYTPIEVIGLHTWDWEANMTEAEIRASFVDLTKTNSVFETRHRRKDGTIYEAEVSASGTSVGDEPMVLTISRDITERKQAEVALRESEERYRTILEKSFDGIFIHDNFKILDLNQAMVKMTGYSRSELLGIMAVDLFTPESKEVIREYISSGSQGSYKIELIRKDGSIRQLESFGAPCKFRGRDARIVAIRDITEM